MRHLIPNSTQIPDVILDHWMAHLSGAEFKIVMYVSRRTFGFGKDSDTISLNQLARGIRTRTGVQLDFGTGLSRSSVKAACASLVSRGILIKTPSTVAGSDERDENAYRLNLYAPMTVEGDSTEDLEEAIEEVGQKSAHVGQKMTYPQEPKKVGRNLTHVGQKSAHGGPEIRQGVGQKLAPQETDQETDQQETAAEGRSANPKAIRKLTASAAAFDFEEGEELTPEGLALSEELIRVGLNRVDAKRLAATSPEECRRQLAYLPFKTDLKNPGAYLRQAIEGSYGPPASYHEARKQETEAQKKRALAESQAAKKAEAERRAEEAAAALDREIEEMREGNPQSFATFETFVEAERARVVSRLPSVRLQDTMNREFERPEKRRELYQKWRART